MLNRIVFFLAVFGMCVTANAQWTTVWQAGEPGRGWPQDQGGVIFVQEAGVNEPPGDPNSPAVDQQADDDYYFAGTYPDPIGEVATDEIAFERAFAGADNSLRIHFNLPDTSSATDKFRFSFEANNLHIDAALNPDPRYGVEVLVNGNLVQSEVVITPAELSTVFTTPEFTAADVGLVAGPGIDNVLTVQGVNHNDDGGGNWMGLDYHHLETNVVPEPGSLGMLLSGLFWAFPLMWSEARKAKLHRKNN